MKAVIVGCGQIADDHVSKIQKIAGAEVVGGSDLYAMMADQLAARCNLNGVYTKR